MKIIKNGLLVLVTTVFIVLGAAMPYLVSQIQDVSLSGFRRNSELNSVSLTLQHETENTVSALELMSRDCTESLWTGETMLTKELARQSAFAALQHMSTYKLPAKGDIYSSTAREVSAEPFLLTADDGNSALIWRCIWHFDDFWATVSVDDATGKAVRIFIDNLTADYKLTDEDIYYQMERWLGFIQDYYDGAVYNIEYPVVMQILYDAEHIGREAEFNIELFPNDGSESRNFSLEITSLATHFNY